MSSQFKLLRKYSTPEFYLEIDGIAVDIVSEPLSFHGFNVISRSVLDLNPEQFAFYKSFLQDNQDLIQALTDLLCHYKCGGTDKFNATQLRLSEQSARLLLNTPDLLTFQEIQGIHEYLVVLNRPLQTNQYPPNILNGRTYIYLIRDHRTDLIKIGRSNDPNKRLNDLMHQSTLLPEPNDFELLFAWLDSPLAERLLHERYAQKRMRGEWFALSYEDVEEIRSENYEAIESAKDREEQIA